MNWIMFYDYTALFLNFFIWISLFYALIALTNIPYNIAVKRNHPQQDAIMIAGWVSLFTLQLLWPLIMIWATLYREDRGWGTKSLSASSEDKINSTEDETKVLKEKIAQLESRFNKLETEQTQLKGGN
ncbi:MAG: DUF3302 domain-containing protein [Sulfurovum sp.]|nr:DUF3302 domain-containing protein [Sulfurovum sp.]